MNILYAKGETDFIGNGIAVLDNALISAKITEDTTSTDYLSRYYAEYELEVNSEEAQLIEKDMIIKSPIPNNQEDYFVVSKIRKDLDVLYVKAIQIFFTMEDNFIEDTNIVDKTGYAALDQMQKATQYKHKFNFYSDISIVNSARMVRKNFVSALMGDDENSFVSRWGGELRVNKFDVYMNATRGQDRGVSIEYRKNLTGLDAIIDYDDEEYYTRVMPEGYDGLFLDEKYVDSPLMDSSRPKVRKIEFSDIKVKQNADDEEGYASEEEAKAALKEAAEKLFSEGKHDIPPASYEINFEELTSTEEYKDYTCLERIWMGDTVTVKHREIGVDISARLVKYEFDAITETYTSLQLGNAVNGITSKYKQLSEKIDNDIETVKTDFQQKYDDAVSELTNKIIEGAHKGHTYTTESEYMVMDTTDPLTAVNVARFNVNGIGFSTTGINGPYVGLTQDGKLVITEATATKFTAALIEAGIITSVDGRTKFDLDTGLITLYDNINKNYSLEIGNNQIVFYDRYDALHNQKNVIGTISSEKVEGTIFGYNIGANNTRYGAMYRINSGDFLMISGDNTVNQPVPIIMVDNTADGANNLCQGSRVAVRGDVVMQLSSAINFNYGNDFSGAVRGGISNGNIDIWGVNDATVTTGNQVHLKVNNTGVEVIGTFTDSSDLAYKKNVKPLNKDTLQILKDIDIYEYEESGTTEIGLLAQEAVKVVPDIIKGDVTETTIEEANIMTEEERAEKLKDGKGASVDVYSMLSLLWDANKKLLGKIEMLENEVKILKERR